MKYYMKYIDQFLNKKTMYQLVFQLLAILAIISVIFGWLGWLSFGGLALLGSAIVLAAACWISNVTFARLFGATTNVESAFITALILFFLIAPPSTVMGYVLLACVGITAMASKYILAIRKKHLFNPAAVAVLIWGILGYTQIAWWVATPLLVIFVAIAGFLILRKIRRFKLFFIFTLVAFLSIFIFTFFNGGTGNLWNFFVQVIESWPLLFFGTVMLTEPITAPTTEKLGITYAVIVGILFGAQFHFGPVYATPELALVIGGLFAYVTGSKYKSELYLKEKKLVAENTYEFTFTSKQKLDFTPGQYLEWTLPHDKPDERGIRRYFTIASSPLLEPRERPHPTLPEGEGQEVQIAIRVSPEKSSSFKKTLLNLKTGDKILAGGLAGDFILPKDTNKKIVMIAGGIGITPFRSQIKYSIDKKQKRDIVLLYANNLPQHVAYKELFDQAEREVGVVTKYSFNNIPIDVAKEVPDYTQRMFYLSGPVGMVDHYDKVLRNAGVHERNIVKDFFPGFA